MTIHHDKLCYGKVEQVDKDMSEEEIIAMLSALESEDCQGEEFAETAEKEDSEEAEKRENAVVNQGRK